MDEGKGAGSDRLIDRSISMVTSPPIQSSLHPCLRQFTIHT